MISLHIWIIFFSISALFVAKIFIVILFIEFCFNFISKSRLLAMNNISQIKFEMYLIHDISHGKYDE